MSAHAINISQSIKQAIAAGSIAQSTVDELQENVSTSQDTRSLAILADAVSDGIVEIVRAESVRTD